MTVFIDIMIVAGALLMVYNILRYYRFIQKIKWMQDNRRDRVVVFLPLILLIMFLAGYLLVAFLGKPDLIIAGILLGGSIFVFIITGLLHFIIDRVNRDTKLEQALEEARRASKAKTTFLSNMSHDIRTPMNAIIGYTQLAKREDASQGEVEEYLDKIDASSQYLLELINDILEMSRIESGKMELENVETSLCLIMSHLRNMFSQQMKDKNIDFTVEGVNLKDTHVVCDEHRLNRVLINLVSNAYKFTPEGGHVSVTLTQTDRTSGEDRDKQNLTGTYEFRVKDDGIGMSPEFAEKIFEAFERERNSTDSGIQGTGLGMSITKSIVDMMDGTIKINTKPNRGSEFVITLCFPLADSGSPTADTDAGMSEDEGIRKDICKDADPVAEPHNPPKGFVGKRLLLTEDNEINREIALIILKEEGFDLDVAENGKIAVDMIASSEPGQYDAVLMDIQMPVMNGYDATAAIRALPDPALAGIPVIAMTANAFQEDIQREHEVGMNAHVTKPINVQELISVLSSFLQ